MIVKVVGLVGIFLIEMFYIEIGGIYVNKILFWLEDVGNFLIDVCFFS